MAFVGMQLQFEVTNCDHYHLSKPAAPGVVGCLRPQIAATKITTSALDGQVEASRLLP